ncbi:MAG: HAD family phosphatase [Chthoniobacterales bacterium]|nr:HAD family phosphatase [Chthoniobacterales bacterium]
MQLELNIPHADYAAVLFDCDGTIADTMLAHYEAWREALGEAARYFSLERHIGWAGLPTEVILAKLNRLHGTKLDPIEFSKLKEKCYLKRLNLIRPVGPVLEYARKQASRVPLAIVSGGRREVVEQTLGALGIRNLFQEVITTEDYQNPKPSPEPFLVAAQKLGVDPHKCLVFEDSQLGVEAAKKAGMEVVYVPTNEILKATLQTQSQNSA